jgi:alpha-tubulin suppressor-like RCC1 family protein
MSISGVSDISAQQTHTCAVLSSGAVKCWGPNDRGQLGDDDQLTSGTPASVLLVNNARVIRAGPDHTCAIDHSNQLWCWGGGGWGLGTAIGGNQLHPVMSSVPADVLDVAVMNGATCVVHTGGTVSCFGGNGEEQLGQGDTAAHNGIINVPGITDATQIAAGWATACVLHASGGVTCWGRNTSGQTGAAASTAVGPTTVPGVLGAVAVAVGNNFACGVVAPGNVLCWGSSSNGQLATLSPTAGANSIPGLSDAVGIACGEYHACAVRASGAVTCWGWRAFGAVDDSNASAANDPTPVNVMLSGTAVQVAAGYGHSCARFADGSMSCWGWNKDGALGDGRGLRVAAAVAVVTN